MTELVEREFQSLYNRYKKSHKYGNRYSPRWTLRSLMLVKRLWRENWDMMQVTKGTSNWMVYVKKERQIDKVEIAIRKYLGCYIGDPCVLATPPISCFICTGRVVKGKKGKMIQQRKGRHREDSRLCSLKGVKIL